MTTQTLPNRKYVGLYQDNINEMLYIVLKSEIKEANNIFPNGLPITNNKYCIKNKYKQNKINNIYTHAIKDSQIFEDFFCGVQRQLDTKQSKVENWTQSYHTIHETLPKMIKYLRFHGGVDTERLKFPHGLSINQQFDENDGSFEDFITKTNQYFSIIFKH